MQKEKIGVGQIGVMLIAAGAAVLLAHLLIRFAWPLILIGVILAVIGYALPRKMR